MFKSIYNKKDMERIEAEIKAALGTPEEDDVINKYEGPDIGFDWDDKAHVLKLSESYVFDADGFIVREDEVTGPGAQ